jgi:hypothetical protein
MFGGKPAAPGGESRDEERRVNPFFFNEKPGAHTVSVFPTKGNIRKASTSQAGKGGSGCRSNLGDRCFSRRSHLTVYSRSR